MIKNKFKVIIAALIISIASALFVGCDFIDGLLAGFENAGGSSAPISLDSIPAFDGSSQYVVINGNVPFFEDEECGESYERFSPLDSLGRCGVAVACVGVDIMPTEDREDIGHVKPSGWHSVQYDIVPGKNLVKETRSAEINIATFCR